MMGVSMSVCNTRLHVLLKLFSPPICHSIILVETTLSSLELGAHVTSYTSYNILKFKSTSGSFALPTSFLKNIEGNIPQLASTSFVGTKYKPKLKSCKVSSSQYLWKLFLILKVLAEIKSFSSLDQSLKKTFNW